jgi:hypothetical protein
VLADWLCLLGPVRIWIGPAKRSALGGAWFALYLVYDGKKSLWVSVFERGGGGSPMA